MKIQSRGKAIRTTGVTNARLTISNTLGTIYDERDLVDNHQSVDFDIRYYPTSFYLVKLFCEGKIVDTKVFVKK